jgi:hypothetical protein
MSSNDEVYRQKYLKYKAKYLELKEQYGGIKFNYGGWIIFLDNTEFESLLTRYEIPEKGFLKLKKGMVQDTFSKFTDELSGKGYYAKVDAKTDIDGIRILKITSDATGEQACNLACAKCKSFYKKIIIPIHFSHAPLKSGKNGNLDSSVPGIFTMINDKINADNNNQPPFIINKAIHFNVEIYGTKIIQFFESESTDT